MQDTFARARTSYAKRARDDRVSRIQLAGWHFQINMRQFHNIQRVIACLSKIFRSRAYLIHFTSNN